MSAKTILTIVITLFISTILCSCVTYKYSKLGVPDVRKVDKYDGNTHLSTFYQKYDEETLGWYEAEKTDDNMWDFTAQGKMERQWKIEEGLYGQHQLLLRKRDW